MNEEIRRELQKLNREEELGDRQRNFTEIVNKAAENHIIEKRYEKRENIYRKKHLTELREKKN